MNPLFRKISTAIRNPHLVLDKTAGVIIDAAWSGSRKTRLLSTWQTPGARSRLQVIVFDRAFRRWIDRVYLTEHDPDRREALKDICMAGQSGVSWADAYDRTPIDRNARCGDLSFDEGCPWFPAMDRVLARMPDDTLVVQIGCSSGREMTYFAKRFPRLSFLGTDIDEQIIRRAVQKHCLPNLAFDVGRAHRLFEIVANNRPLILYSNGSLQYVQPEHLQLMFESIKKRGNTMLLLGEPWRSDGPQVGTALSRWRGNFSFSHDYREYADRVGLKLLESDLIQTHTDPLSIHFWTRHYYLWTIGDNIS